jgi:hypothetical protein
MLTAHAQIPAASRDKIMDRTSTPPCLFFIQCAHFLVASTCVRCLTFTENPQAINVQLSRQRVVYSLRFA